MQSIFGTLPIQHPPQTRSCLKRFAGNRNSNKFSDHPRVSHGASDMKRRKRVKFVERDAIRADVSSLSTVRSHASNCDDLKTSEYKSFKKLLQEAGRSSHSHKPVRQGSVLSSSRTRGTRNKHTCNNEATGSVVPVEKFTPINQEPPLLPIRASDDIEPQYKNGGTFYEKRQNLIKSAASAMSLEVNELLSKGCDLIPVFLHRLGINRKADNCDELRKMNNVDSNVRSQLLACPNMQNCLEELYQTPETKWMPNLIRDITKNNFPGGWWNSADELYCPMEHVEAQFFPIWNMTKSDLPKHPSHSNFLLDSLYLPAKDRSDLDFNPSAEVAISRCKGPTLNNKIPMSRWVSPELPPFWGPYEEQPVLSQSNFHFLELDILHSPNKAKRFSTQHSSLPLLGWNKEINNEEELFVASDSSEMEELYQLPLTLYHVPQSHGPVGDSEVIDSCTRGIFFPSFGDTRILKDMIYPSLVHALVPSRTESAVGSEWQDLSTDYCREIFSSYDTHRPLSCISRNAFQRRLVEPSDTGTRNQITSMICDLYDLSSFGFGISPERKTIFPPATDE